MPWQRGGTGRVPVLAFMEELRMIRRRGRVASLRTRSVEPVARLASTAAADGPLRTTLLTRPTAPTFRGREPTTREIRDRAYFIYLARGGTNGDPVADWTRAERELRTELRGAASGRGRF
jgi:hypothetical protein